jgi:hypothetical protein
LNLTQHQITQAKTQRQAADGVVHARLPEMYQWLIVPTQENPQAQVAWQALKLSGTDALADRACKKLKNDELLVTNLASTRLRMELDRVPLWRGNHVAVRQLVEDFGKYLYLPRLQQSAVLLNAIRSGLSLLTWEKDSFAYAESYDEQAQRYRGLRHGAIIPVTSIRKQSLLRLPPETKRLQEEPTRWSLRGRLKVASLSRRSQSVITAQFGWTQRAWGVTQEELPTRSSVT